MQASFRLPPLPLAFAGPSPSTAKYDPTTLEGELADERFLEADKDAQLEIVMEDFRAAHCFLDAGMLAQYSGQFVGVLRGRMVGAGPASEELRARIAQEFKIHPERPAIIFIDDGRI